MLIFKFVSLVQTLKTFKYFKIRANKWIIRVFRKIKCHYTSQEISAIS